MLKVILKMLEEPFWFILRSPLTVNFNKHKNKSHITLKSFQNSSNCFKIN